MTSPNPVQFDMPLESSEDRANRLLSRLREMGLDYADSCRLTRNHSTMVSLFKTQLRVHEGYVDAPTHVLRAIVSFFTEGRQDKRLRARRIILSHHIPREERVRRRRVITLAADAEIAEKLAEWHLVLNERHFEGKLAPMRPQVSRRMRSRLGYYAPASKARQSSAEIVISRHHIVVDGWIQAIDTLLHEMIHQWQDENGLPLDHGRHFRAKAIEVGTAPSARRPCDVSLTQ